MKTMADEIITFLRINPMKSFSASELWRRMIDGGFDAQRQSIESAIRILVSKGNLKKIRISKRRFKYLLVNTEFESRRSRRDKVKDPIYCALNIGAEKKLTMCGG